MSLFFTVITLVSAVLMIIVILLQQSKGSELGAAFGSGARGGLFTAQGKANFLTRTTRWLMTIFLLSSLALSIFLVDNRQDGVLENLQAADDASAAGQLETLDLEADAAADAPAVSEEADATPAAAESAAEQKPAIPD